MKLTHLLLPLVCLAVAAPTQAQSTKLSYATFFGGNLKDDMNDMAIDPQGNLYFAGTTQSNSLPTSHGTKPKGGDDVLVVKLDPSASRVIYAVIFGGALDDVGYAIAVDAQGNAYVAGTTASADFPVKNPYQATKRAAQDVFVMKLDPTGQMVYSTFLGGSDQQPCGCTANDRAWGLAVDRFGRAHVTGGTYSRDFPTTVASTGGDNGDAFLTVLNETGDKLVFSVVLGGRDFDAGGAVAFDRSGHMFWGGATRNALFPSSPDAIQKQHSGGVPYGDVFVIEGDTSAAEKWMVRSTLLGGSGSEWVTEMVFDKPGNLWLTGRTTSRDFPLSANAFQKVWGGGTAAGDMFLTRITPTLDKVLYSTFIGGAGEDIGYGIAFDNLGYVHVTGYTQSSNIAVTRDAFHPYRGQTDALYAKFPPEGGQPEFMTYIGGTSNDTGIGIVADAAGQIWQAGQTKSYDFYGVGPTILQDGLRGDYDWFVMKMESSVSPDGPIRVSSVANAASYESGKVSPGEIVTIFGEGLGPAEIKTAPVNGDGRLATEADGVQVLFDGIPARIIYVLRSQLAAIVPYGVQGRGRTMMTVSRNGKLSEPVALTVAEAVPGLFTADGSGRGPAAALNQDGSLNAAGRGAERGAVIVLYGTGEGQTTPTGQDGKPAPGDAAGLPRPVLQPQVTIGGQPATIHYAGGVPFVTSGEFQMNVQVPAGVATGNQEVVVRFGNYSSPAGVTVNIR